MRFRGAALGGTLMTSPPSPPPPRDPLASAPSPLAPGLSGASAGETPNSSPSSASAGAPAQPTPTERDARFVDEVTLTVESGAGGNGLVAWLRSKRQRLGGPAGGNGGNGGSVVFVADEGLSTLLDLKHRRLLRAPRGRSGGPNNRTGAAGEDLLVRVPVGTLIADRASGELLADLTVSEQRHVAVRGGRGGRGNHSFTSSTRRAPDFAEPGEPGEARDLRLTLKLLADVGIVGFPNSGKSTLISKISNARPKIADYPFTTLVPNLGVVRYHDRDIVVADIPGLIEGAAEGAGLGVRFLRHVERCALFLFLLDTDCVRPDPRQSLSLLEDELRRYSPELASRPRIVALNKVDLPEVREQIVPLQQELAGRGLTLVPISAVTGEGIAELLLLLATRLAAPAADP